MLNLNIVVLFLIIMCMEKLQPIDGFIRPRTCGIQASQERITNGEEAGIDEYPWLALLRYRHEKSDTETWGCGGTLIGMRTILTAAHCVENQTTMFLGELIFIRLGEYDISTANDCIVTTFGEDCSEQPIDIKPKEIIIHPERNIRTRRFDIAIVILETEPPYTDFIRPICLPTSQEYEITSKSKLFAAGWGYTNGSIASPSNKKLFIKINKIDTGDCELRLGKFINDTENCEQKMYNINLIDEMVKENCFKKLQKFRLDTINQVCAGGQKGKNTCRGDSGGPLMTIERNTWLICGVVSLGPSYCGIKDVDGKPSIYTKVSSFLDWINLYLK